MEKETNLRFFTLAIGVAIAHIVTGILLLTGGIAATKSIPLALVSLIFDNLYSLVTALIVASIFAIWAFIGKRSRLKTLIMLAPQQFILGLSMIAAVAAITVGSYPDGYTPNGGWIFITIDQIWLLTICFWHTIEYGAIFSEKKRTEL